MLPRPGGPQFQKPKKNPVTFGWLALIYALTAAYLVAGTAAFVLWRNTGNEFWVNTLFRAGSSVLLVFLAALQFWLSARVCGQFASDDALRRAWLIIAASAGFDFVASLVVQAPGLAAGLGFLVRSPAWPGMTPGALRSIGLVVGGTCRFALLAGGLLLVLRVYRRSGFLGRPSPLDWLLLGLLAAYIGREAWDTAREIRRGAAVSAPEVLTWPVDPLLLALLAEGMLLARSVQGMGMSAVGRVWQAFSTGIFLVSLGDVGLWAEAYSYLRWPYTAAIWYIWVPASAAFALAPAYQLKAMREAGQGES
ncbi:MAG TPA: hypothetical protein VGF59_27220 [Bryobacteraceae bacterium]